MIDDPPVLWYRSINQNPLHRRRLARSNVRRSPASNKERRAWSQGDIGASEYAVRLRTGGEDCGRGQRGMLSRRAEATPKVSPAAHSAPGCEWLPIRRPPTPAGGLAVRRRHTNGRRCASAKPPTVPRRRLISVPDGRPAL